MSKPWILKAAIIPKADIEASGFDHENFQYRVDVITPEYTLHNFKRLNNFVFGFNKKKDQFLIIDLQYNPDLKIVPCENIFCAN